MGLEGSNGHALSGVRVQKVQRVHKVQRAVVGALMGASINAALRQQENLYNRPVGEEMHSPFGDSAFGGWRHYLARWAEAQ